MSDDTRAQGPPGDQVGDWIWFSNYDLETSRVALAACRYLHVYFLCQQAVEKRLKAICSVSREEAPPYTRRLMRLAEICGLKPSTEQQELMLLLTDMYGDVRYPSGALPPEANDPRLASEALAATEEMLRWLDQHLAS